MKRVQNSFPILGLWNKNPVSVVGWRFSVRFGDRQGCQLQNCSCQPRGLWCSSHGVVSFGGTGWV